MICSPEWPDFWDHLASGEWEPWTLEILSGVRGRYVDVGAWVGPTVIAAKGARERVAIEPDPEARRMLLANLEEADVAAAVWPCAVGAEAGTVTLRATRVLGNSETTMLGHGDGDPFDVPAIPLHEVGDADLIKIDIEGAEAQVLPAARAWLDGTRPILVSLHPQFMDMTAVLEVLGDYADVSFEGAPVFPDRPCAVLAR